MTVPRIPNDEMVYDYLNWAFFDHTEDTFFRGIKRLMPAHYMVIKNHKIKTVRYWDIDVNPDMDRKTGTSSDTKTDDEYAQKFYELIEDAVRLRCISEVPVGSRLSGGLDSSAIVCIINQLLFSDLDRTLTNKKLKNVIGTKQKVFSAVYKDKEVDEREYITEVVNKVNVEKNYTFPTYQKLWKDIQKMVYYHDEPFVSTSTFAGWTTTKLASKKVTVLLDGQGADELIAGYYPYYGIYFLNLLDNKKYFQLFKEFAFSFDIIYPILKFYLTRIAVTEAENDLKIMLDDEFKQQFMHIERLEIGRVLSQSLYRDMVKFSIPRILRMVDRNSMAFSVEVRVPFLDHRLVEYVFSLPADQKIRNGWTKFILRNSTKGVLPEKIRLRRSKIGFATPEVDWLKQLEPEFMKIFSSERFKNRKYFDQKEVLRIYKKFCQGRLNTRSDSEMFWRIVNLELWLEMFIDDWEKWVDKIPD